MHMSVRIVHSLLHVHKTLNFLISLHINISSYIPHMKIPVISTVPAKMTVPGA